MTHPALHETAHRPWPLPARPWVLTMAWQDLLFLHWPVPAAWLQSQLPAGLELELYDGSAWLGIVPFRMAATRPRWLPPFPTASAFPELNLRTYVRVGDRPGVWFFSLDAASRLAVFGARLSFGLPYFHATMASSRTGDWLGFASERRDRRAPPASFAARWRPLAAPQPAPRGSLAHWLVERYCLYAWRRGRLVRGEIAHQPWLLAPAELAMQQNDMTQLLGAPLLGRPVSVLAACDLEVAAYAPVAAGLSAG